MTMYCETCWEGKFFKCYYCENTFRQQNRYETPDEEDACEDCYNDKFFTCDRCQDTQSNDEYAEDGICNTCFNA